MTQLTAEALEQVLLQLVLYAPTSHLAPVAQHDEAQLWRYLANCVLSSQVPYETAVVAAQHLYEIGLPWAKEPLSTNGLRERIERSLSAHMRVKDRFVRYRFPHRRAVWLSEGIMRVRDKFGSLGQLLRDLNGPTAIRRYLVSNIPGIGPKQASMFLRDTGVTQDMAIIDTHIAKFMTIVCGAKIAPGALSTLKRYETHEAELRAYVKRWNAPMSTADRAIWATMRAASGLRLL